MNAKTLYLNNDEVYNYYRQFKDGVYKDLDSLTLMMIKKFLEGCARYELDDISGSIKYERTYKRKDFRNGYRYRWFNTNYGDVKIKLGRLRNTRVNYSFIERYKRRSEKVNRMIRRMFFDGVGVRKINRVLSEIFDNGYYISRSTVSRIIKEINDEINKWSGRNLEDRYEIVILDGVYMKLRSPVKSERRVILVAYGITGEGMGEVIGFKVASYGESEVAWSNFINELYHRGLEGKKLKLAIIDGNKGLKNAIELVWPEVVIQRCWVHKMRNVINYFPHRLREEAGKDLKRIYSAGTKHKAIDEFRVFKQKWQTICPKGVRCLEKDFEEMLNYYDVIEQISIEDKEKLVKMIKTTNIIERIFREVRRRTRSIGVFTNRDSVVRVVYNVFREHNEKQREKIKNAKITKSSLNRIYTQIGT